MKRPSLATTKTALAACLLVLLPSVSFAMSGAQDPHEVYHPQVREVSGPVSVQGTMHALWEPVEAGMLLLAGDVLKTGKDGYAAIEFASGTLEIYETTVIVIPSIGLRNRKKDIREVLVEEGKTLFDINPLGVERGFEFRTRNVQGGVKGTLFTVSYLKGGTAVNVYRGSVRVSDTEGSPETIRDIAAGHCLRVEAEEDFGGVLEFAAESALEDYSYNIPPGLDDKGLPSDYNANPDNKGVRDRGEGKGLIKDDKD